MPDWPTITGILHESGVEMASTARPRSIAGGDISEAWRVETCSGPVFLKTGPAREYDRLCGEAEGLRALAEPAALRVPRVLACSEKRGEAVLALEWLDFERPDGRVEALFGRQLAALHRTTHGRYGWHRDNSIGKSPQKNTPDDDWARFFRVQRLGYQLELAAANGFGGELQTAGARLMNEMDRFFDGHRPPASLLHGDLWGGNRASVGGEPAVFDPAVYHGDRETDIAMTRLFGGFGESFYRAYLDAWPLPPGHRQREPLYQLYHVLNHLNLFGAAWLARATEIIRRLNRL